MGTVVTLDDTKLTFGRLRGVLGNIVTDNTDTATVAAPFANILGAFNTTRANVANFSRSPANPPNPNTWGYATNWITYTPSGASGNSSILLLGN